jgi:hypothetical protein
LELAFLRDSPRLTAHEKRIIDALVDAVVATDGSLHDAVDQMQTTYGALNRALQRIRAKTA